MLFRIKFIKENSITKCLVKTQSGHLSSCHNIAASIKSRIPLSKYLSLLCKSFAPIYPISVKYRIAFYFMGIVKHE